MMKIPYGLANFGAIRRDGLFYADKTRFIERLESDVYTPRYLLFLRPKGFGKSLLLSLLAHYYDVALRDEFDTLFDGLWIHDHPTPERNQYLILHFDLSPVNVSKDPREVERAFRANVEASLSLFLSRYASLGLDASSLIDRLPSYPDASTMVDAVLSAVEIRGHRVYVLIDGYDSMANDLLTRGYAQTYDDLSRSLGCVHAFYRALKSGTHNGSVIRVFITGVTPNGWNDMARGFDIAYNLSDSRAFGALCGFTADEVAQAVDTLLAEKPSLGSRDELLNHMTRYYDGYQFSRRDSEKVFNPTLVLYYLRHLGARGEPPRDLLDDNVWTNYTRLRKLTSRPGESPTWHLSFLSELLSQGEIIGSFVTWFDFLTLYDQGHLISLLYHTGLLTLAGSVRTMYRFVVPNLVARYMHWEEMRVLLKEYAGVTFDTRAAARAVEALAVDGNLDPFLEQVREQVLEKLSNQRVIRLDEKLLKPILLAYLNLSPLYQPLSEQEFNHGHEDLFLALDHRFPDARVSWLLELKSLEAGASEEAVMAARAEARAQIDRYLEDAGALRVLMGNREIRAATAVLVGATDLRWWVERVVPTE